MKGGGVESVRKACKRIRKKGHRKKVREIGLKKRGQEERKVCRKKSGVGRRVRLLEEWSKKKPAEEEVGKRGGKREAGMGGGVDGRKIGNRKKMGKEEGQKWERRDGKNRRKQ
jgi:hypothetical protein